MPYSEEDILTAVDLAFNGEPDRYCPPRRDGFAKHIFFLDLEHGYFHTAGSRIHVYADKDDWAIVLEKNGYANRVHCINAELNYVGNCIDYPIERYGTDSASRGSVSNTTYLELMDELELLRIGNKQGTESEQDEWIDPQTETVMVRNREVAISTDPDRYARLGIRAPKVENPNRPIDYEELPRYLHATQPEALFAEEQEIRTRLPEGIPKIITISEFHHLSSYQDDKKPSDVETYQLLAKVVTGQSAEIWQPTLEPNNHWSNWESGHL